MSERPTPDRIWFDVRNAEGALRFRIRTKRDRPVEIDRYSRIGSVDALTSTFEPRHEVGICLRSVMESEMATRADVDRRIEAERSVQRTLEACWDDNRNALADAKARIAELEKGAGVDEEREAIIRMLNRHLEVAESADTLRSGEEAAFQAGYSRGAQEALLSFRREIENCEHLKGGGS